MGSSQGYEDRAELIRYASTFAVLSVLLPNMFDQVAVALLLLAGITFVYVIGIGQSHPPDRVDKKGRLDGRR
jgi:ATP-dependent helicase/DNAse subunit B